MSIRRARAAGWAAIALGAAIGPCAAQSVPEVWYATARSGITTTDRNLRNDGRHDALALGRAFAREYALELEVTRARLDVDRDDGRIERSVALNLLIVNREPLWDPYFLVGIGGQRVEAAPGVPRRTGSDLMFNLGIGGQWELILPARLYLRADLRLRYAPGQLDPSGQDGVGDGVFTLGLSLPFAD